MEITMNLPEIYLSPPHACEYLKGELASILFLSPEQTLSMRHYSQLVSLGFRRSGRLVYRPKCQHCQACIAVRIPVQLFHPKRHQQRCWKRNQDLEIIARPAEYQAEHYELYLRYLQARHANGSMVDSSPADYQDFLTCHWCETLFYEFRRGSKLMAVAVTDLLDDGLSAVYTFFDPDENERSLGTFAIMSQIEAAKRMNTQYLYLGYWIGKCGKMAYKSRFEPLEILKGGRWQVLEVTSDSGSQEI